MVGNIDQDITAITKGIICHQVNCRGVMGGGLALQIRNKFPKAYQDYLTAYHNAELTLGKVIISHQTKDPLLIVAHLCGQDRYGHGKQYTDYDALEKCLSYLRRMKEYHKRVYNEVLNIYLPKMIGSGLAGGDWNVVRNLIHVNLPSAIICNYG